MTDAADHGSTEPQYEVDLIRIIGRLWAARWWIAAWIAFCAGLAIAYVLIVRPEYRAQAVAVVASPDGANAPQLPGELGGLASLIGFSFGASGDVEETLAVLRSREFSEQFILDHGLMPTMFPRSWDEQTKRWKEGEEPTLSEVYERFDENVRSASQDKKTGLVTISIVWPDPAVAAQLANDLVHRLNLEMRSRAAARAEASLKFLDQELEKAVAVDTRQAISRLIESQINQRMYTNITEEFALRVVDRALPPDPRHPVRPRRVVALAASLFIGFVLGCLFVLGVEYLRYIKAQLRAA